MSKDKEQSVEGPFGPMEVQTLLDALVARGGDIEFSVSALDDSLVEHGIKHCFQVGTYLMFGLQNTYYELIGNV